MKAAIKSSLEDGKVSESEKEMIAKAAEGLTKAKKTKVMKALEEGEFSEEVGKILESLEL